MNIYLESFGIFFKIGAFTIGGGYAMVPLIENEIVTKRHQREPAANLPLKWRIKV